MIFNLFCRKIVLNLFSEKESLILVRLKLVPILKLNFLSFWCTVQWRFECKMMLLKFEFSIQYCAPFGMPSFDLSFFLSKG